MINIIVVPLDGSDSAFIKLALACDRDEKYEARLLLQATIPP